MIQVENLTKYYSDLCAVDQINLEIQKGEILGLLGPNGAGKTTTLRMLTGFLRPSSGNVNILNHNIEEHPLEIKKILGYLPESAPLYHDMLVYDYLNYVADIREILDTIEAAGLSMALPVQGEFWVEDGLVTEWVDRFSWVKVITEIARSLPGVIKYRLRGS